MKNIEEPLGSGYSRIKDLSHYEVQKLAIYYNRLGNLNTMVTNFMLSILIYRFTDLKDRYSPRSDGLKILQKIIMDQIASLLRTIDTYRPRHEDQFDPCYAIQNLNSMWRWVLFMNTGNKILDDIQAYYLQ